MKNEIPVAGVAHQAGTCRFGSDPATSVLDVDCKAHELDNLYVVDTSVFPSIGAVNPALTAMANSLRVGDHLLDRLGRAGPRGRARPERHGADERRSRFGAVGRLAFFPARVAARASRGPLEAAADEHLVPELSRLIDRALEQSLPEELVHSLVEHQVLERMATEFAATGELDDWWTRRWRARAPRAHRQDRQQRGDAEGDPRDRREQGGSRRSHGADDRARRGARRRGARRHGAPRRQDRPQAGSHGPLRGDRHPGRRIRRGRVPDPRDPHDRVRRSSRCSRRSSEICGRPGWPGSCSARADCLIAVPTSSFLELRRQNPRPCTFSGLRLRRPSGEPPSVVRSIVRADRDLDLDHPALRGLHPGALRQRAAAACPTYLAGTEVVYAEPDG